MPFRYTAQKKATIVKQVRDSGRSVSAVARDAGIPPTTVSRWLRTAPDQPKTPTVSRPEPRVAAPDPEIKRLRRLTSRLTRENRVLREAIVVVAAPVEAMPPDDA